MEINSFKVKSKPHGYIPFKLNPLFHHISNSVNANHSTAKHGLSNQPCCISVLDCIGCTSHIHKLFKPIIIEADHSIEKYLPLHQRLVSENLFFHFLSTSFSGSSR